MFTVLMRKHLTRKMCPSDMVFKHKGKWADVLKHEQFREDRTMSLKKTISTPLGPQADPGTYLNQENVVEVPL